MNECVQPPSASKVAESNSSCSAGSEASFGGSGNGGHMRKRDRIKCKFKKKNEMVKRWLRGLSRSNDEEFPAADQKDLNEYVSSADKTTFKDLTPISPDLASPLQVPKEQNSDHMNPLLTTHLYVDDEDANRDDFYVSEHADRVLAGRASSRLREFTSAPDKSTDPNDSCRPELTKRHTSAASKGNGATTQSQADALGGRATASTSSFSNSRHNNPTQGAAGLLNSLKLEPGERFELLVDPIPAPDRNSLVTLSQTWKNMRRYGGTAETSESLTLPPKEPGMQILYGRVEFLLRFCVGSKGSGAWDCFLHNYAQFTTTDKVLDVLAKFLRMQDPCLCENEQEEENESNSDNANGDGNRNKQDDEASTADEPRSSDADTVGCSDSGEASTPQSPSPSPSPRELFVVPSDEGIIALLSRPSTNTDDEAKKRATRLRKTVSSTRNLDRVFVELGLDADDLTLRENAHCMLGYWLEEGISQQHFTEEDLARVRALVEEADQALGVELETTGDALGEDYAMPGLLEIPDEQDAITGAPQDAQELAAMLQRNSTVTDLNLCNANVKMGASGAKEVAETMLNSDTKLRRIALADNDIRDEGAVELARALETNKTVIELRLANNRIGQDGTEAFADALAKNCTLTALELWDNPIGEKGTLALMHALDHNSTLKRLGLDTNDNGNDRVIPKAKNNAANELAHRPLNNTSSNAAAKNRQNLVIDVSPPIPRSFIRSCSVRPRTPDSTLTRSNFGDVENGANRRRKEKGKEKERVNGQKLADALPTEASVPPPLATVTLTAAATAPAITAVPTAATVPATTPTTMISPMSPISTTRLSSSRKSPTVIVIRKSSFLKKPRTRTNSLSSAVSSPFWKRKERANTQSSHGSVGSDGNIPLGTSLLSANINLPSSPSIQQRAIDWEKDLGRFAPTEVAQCLTWMLYNDCYRHIQPRDLISVGSREQNPLVQKMIETFDIYSWWPLTWVLGRHLDLNERKERVAFLLNVATECRRLHNFHAFFGIVAGLSQPLLGWMWAFFNKALRQRLEQLQRATRVNGDYLVYRADLSKCINKSHIPFLAVTTKVLVPLENSVPVSSKSQPAMVNFARCVSIQHTIDDFLRGQRLGYETEGQNMGSDTLASPMNIASFSATHDIFGGLALGSGGGGPLSSSSVHQLCSSNVGTNSSTTTSNVLSAVIPPPYPVRNIPCLSSQLDEQQHRCAETRAVSTSSLSSAGSPLSSDGPSPSTGEPSSEGNSQHQLHSGHTGSRTILAPRLSVQYGTNSVDELGELSERGVGGLSSPVIGAGMPGKARGNSFSSIPSLSTGANSGGTFVPTRLRADSNLIKIIEIGMQRAKSEEELQSRSAKFKERFSSDVVSTLEASGFL